MTDLGKAADEMLQCVDRMLRDGEWYAAQEKADNLRAALEQALPLSDDAIEAALSAWFCDAGALQSVMSFESRMRAAIKAANDFKEEE